MVLKNCIMKIVGIENKKGEYQGRAYNNYIIHGLESDPNVVGKVKCVNVKFKPDSLSLICDLQQLDKLIGKEVDRVFYDRYGNATELRFK